MHRHIFGHSFAVLVAPILLSVLAVKFLNKKRTRVDTNAEDADAGAPDSSTETNSEDADASAPDSSTETNLGASSSSTTPTEFNDGTSSWTTIYEVFLSFRGPDTRNGFTDHLYNGLGNAGIHTFRDDNELRRGEEMGPDLLEAIKNSKILIPILSVNYGGSRWCLDELVQIMECRKNSEQPVWPIFYKVGPADVRYQKGSFGDAFHEIAARRSDPEILEKWKQALEEVGCLKGWEANGDEAELVELVVRKVLVELKKRFELIVAEYLVGIGEDAKKVVEYVQNNSHAVLFIGIHGMGGIGKTTLAKAIYNELSSQFKCQSFIADIREVSKRGGIVYLQSQLISDILQRQKDFHDEEEGTMFLSSEFRRKKVLILLDDVDDYYQLKGLAGNHNWFSSGSTILITTRDERILATAKVDYSYEHKPLDEDQSLILFSRHTFRRDSPPHEFEDLSRVVVSTTGGLPLSLVVVGSLLSGKKRDVWLDTLTKLREIPLEEVQGKLLISFEALDDCQKQIFLDIACLLIGTDVRIACYMWDSCNLFPMQGIETLIFMSLIKVGHNNEFQMHNQLRDFGRQIVRQESPRKPQHRSRLWDSREVLKVLEQKKGTRKIEVISTELYRGVASSAGDTHTDEQLKNLRNLRILHASGARFSGDFKNLFRRLRWLRWRYCPLTFEAENFHTNELAVLDLSRSKISDQWRGWSAIMMSKKLKFLDLSHCPSLKGTFFLSAFQNLEVLILRDCEEVEQIDSSIGDLKRLVCLDLTKCRSLKVLPVEVAKLKALEQLLLEGNQKISEVPDIGDLENLEILNISGTGIKELPNGIGRLRKLRVLDASKCTKLRGEMAGSIRNLSFLQHLDFHGCEKLQELPELPSSLAYLSVTCQSGRLPSLSHLTHLKELQLLDCRSLECISELPSTLLELSKCSQPTDVEESKLPRSLHPLFKLEILKMHGCKLVKTLDVSQLDNLRKLDAESCINLLEIQGLDKLKYLESLTITKCTSIERLDLLNIGGLKILRAGDCKKLVEIQGLDRLEVLQELDIAGCILIEKLDLTSAEGLKILNAKHCKRLVRLQGLERLEFLEVLTISGCALIDGLDLSECKRLKKLEARACEKLVGIQGLDGLKFLEELDISSWVSIERLDLPESNRLRILNAKHCRKLIEIQNIDKLELLEELDISGCTSIKKLDLSKSKNLTSLDAKKCKKLVKIQGELESLVELNVSECPSMESLDLSKSTRLKELHATDSDKLVVQGIDGLEFLKSHTSSGALQ